MFSDCILLPLGDKSNVLNLFTEFSVSPSQSVQAFDVISVPSQMFRSVSDALVDQGVIFPNGFLGCFPGRRSEKYGHELCSRAWTVEDLSATSRNPLAFPGSPDLGGLWIPCSFSQLHLISLIKTGIKFKTSQGGWPLSPGWEILVFPS